MKTHKLFHLVCMLIALLPFYSFTCGHDDGGDPNSPPNNGDWDTPGQTEYYAGDEIPEDVRLYPEAYGFTQAESAFIIAETSCEKIVQDCWIKSTGYYGGIAICPGESKFIGCSRSSYESSHSFGETKWIIPSDGYTSDSDNQFAGRYVFNAQPRFALVNEKKVPSFVAQNPELCGLEKLSCLMSYVYFSDYSSSVLMPIDVWQSGNLFFAPGNEPWQNVALQWYSGPGAIFQSIFPKDGNGYYDFAEDTIWECWGTSNETAFDFSTYRVYFIKSTVAPPIAYVDQHDPTHFDISKNGNNFRFCFDVYVNGFGRNDFHIECGNLWYSVKAIDVYDHDRNYNINAVRVYVTMSVDANSGAERSNYFYVVFDTPKPIWHQSLAYTLKQAGTGSSSGGSSGGTDAPGADWTRMEVDAYGPYWYCAQTGKTIPSNPQWSKRTVYRSPSGQYKISYAGKYYNARSGYNKLALDREAHSYYNSAYDYWGSCTDYYYLEFTL